MPPTLPDARPRVLNRCFVSPLVEERLEAAAAQIHDPSVRQIFSNCWPNTLDTTVFDYDLDLKIKEHELCRPMTWVITGDIPATWLRDGANQVIPYLDVLASNKDHPDWIALYRLVLGVIYSQARCILHHPFSNAYIPPSSSVDHDNTDSVDPPIPPNEEGSLRVWESKYELDSLASFLDLSGKVAEAGGRTDFVHCKEWRDAARLVVRVCRLQQRATAEEVEILPVPWWGPVGSEAPNSSKNSTDDDYTYDGPSGVYRFQRDTRTASETRSLGGLGEPVRRCGLIRSAFRPSDDATIYQFLIPSNAFASVALSRLSDVIDRATVSDHFDVKKELETLSKDMRDLGDEVKAAVWDRGVVEVTNAAGRKESVFAYEVDGFGSCTIADDANIPSLLSLPHLGFVSPTDPVYVATRNLILSDRNKWWFSGKAGSGIGGMHIGFIWPMSIIMRALTSDDDEEILDCLDALKRTTAGTGFMHESFHVSDARNFTRAHFSWANGLFGQLCLHLLATRPYLL